MTSDITPSDIELAQRRIKAGDPDDETVALLVRRGIEPAVAAQLLCDLRTGQPVKGRAVVSHLPLRSASGRGNGSRKSHGVTTTVEPVAAFTATSGPPSFFLRNGWALLALVPLLILLGVVCRFGVAVPFWDQWELVTLLEKSYHGHLSFSDF